MAEIIRLALTKIDLDKIPGDERFFYLVAGQLANDVNILSKLLIGAQNVNLAADSERLNDPRRHAGLTQIILLIKLLAARLHEANVFIGQHYFGKKLHEKYESVMSAESQQFRRQFTSYFGRSTNVLTRIRNKFASHIDQAELGSVYNALESDFPFTQYLGEYIGHTLFYGSETLSIIAMASLADNSVEGVIQAIDKIHLDTIQVSQWLGHFLIGYIDAINEQFLQDGLLNSLETINFADDIAVDSFVLPFFFAPPAGSTGSDQSD
jgi:hypothetical protein